MNPVRAVAAPARDVAVAPRARAHRNPGIEAGRAVAIAAVVVLHAVTPTPHAFGVHPSGVVDQLCRWAVPFFFVTAGYALGRRALAPGPAAAAVLARLAPVFLAWSLVYLLLSAEGLGQLARPHAAYRWLATGGPGWHLWFLPSLALCLALLLAMRAAGLAPRTMLAIALGTYALGLALGPYHPLLAAHDAALPDGQMPILDGRGGPFPLAFVVVGYWLAASGADIPARVGPALLLAGGGLHLAEAFCLDAGGWTPFVRNDLLVGTLAFGTGAFLVLARAPAGPVVRAVGGLGRYSLGVYAFHVLVLVVLRRLLHPTGLAESLGLAAGVLAVSTTAVVALARLRVLRPLLT